MSESTRAAVARSLFERWNKLDYDGIRNIVTDDFLYQLEPEPVGLASYTKPGITKAKFEDFHLEIDKEHKDHQTTIESIHEVGDKVLLRAKDRFSNDKLGKDEHTFHAEFIFRGDKIQLLKIVLDDGGFADRWKEYFTAPP